MAFIINTPARFYRVLHRIADSEIGPTERAFLRAIKQTVDGIDESALQEALASQNVQAVFDAVGIDGQLAPRVRENLRTTLQRAFTRAVIAVETVTELPEDFVFRIANRRAVRAANKNLAQLVTRVSTQTKATIRRVINLSQREGETIRDSAKLIRNVVGLTDKQGKAVLKYRATLQAEGLTADAVAAKAEKYAAKLLRYRSNVIARTETMRYVSGAQDELWAQAVDSGAIDPEEMREFWIVAPDEKLCPQCRSIPELNPDGVEIGEEFKMRDAHGKIVMVRRSPDPHPQCRCAKGLKRVKQTWRKAA